MLNKISLVILLLMASSVAIAQYDRQKKERSNFGTRDGRFETSVILAYQSGINEASEGGSSLDIDTSAGWGVSFGWNWTAKLNLSYRLMANKPSYLAVIVPEDPGELTQTFEQKLSKYSHQLNMTYHFLDGSFTPYISGGFGYTKLDSNIIEGPSTVGCWWDPWWGYICFGEWETFSTSELSYNVGIGLRWDLNNALYTRAAYNREFISLKNGKIDFDTMTLEVGLVF